ncbi:MAG: hypothetical protein AB7I36_11685 [Rhodospirillaceae bacterium]
MVLTDMRESLGGIDQDAHDVLRFFISAIEPLVFGASGHRCAFETFHKARWVKAVNEV